MNRGFIPPLVVPEDYFLGSGKLGSIDINPKGDWRPYLPKFELQNQGEETQACVSFAILSALEMLHRLQYGSEPNYSDRFLAKLSGTDPTGGNTPKIVSNTLRKRGCVPETEWPFDNSSLENFYKTIPQKLIDMGAGWLKEYEWGYEFVDIDKLKDALKRSPVAVAVNAWSTNDKGEYIRTGASNHYVVLVAFDELDRPVIFDSYESSIKTLEKDYIFEFPQMYVLKKKEIMIESWKKAGFYRKAWLIIKKFLWIAD